MKRFISTILALTLCLCLLTMPALAAGANATLTGPDTVRAGDTIMLTFSLNGSGLFGAQGVLSYDSNHLELKETKQQVGDGWVVEFNGNNFVAYDNNLAKPINKNTALFTLSFKVKSNVSAGTTIQVSYTDVAASDGNTESALGTVSYTATVAAPKSKDNTLKSLTVGNATISPAFSAGTTDYTAEVPFDVRKLEVKAEANDGKAKVKIDNPELTPGGKTKVTVTVTAENGDKKTYTITVSRAQDPNYQASSNSDLHNIVVNGFLLSPVFSADNTQYIVWLPYETDSVIVSGTPADSKAGVTVEGGDALVAGADNEIKVICTAEDGSQKIYTIIAKRAPAHGAENEPTDPTEPAPTEPAPTEPQATEPAPTEPQIPDVSGNQGGIPWWTLLLVGILCLGAGVAVGMVIGKKKG